MADLDQLTGLGVGGIFAILVLKLVFDHLKTKKNGPVPTIHNIKDRFGGIEKTLVLIKKDVADLREWHDVTDDEGVRLWYTRNKSLEAAIVTLSTAIQSLADLHREQMEVLKDIRRDVKGG